MERKEKNRGPGFVLVIAILLFLVAIGVSIPYFTNRNDGMEIGSTLGSLVGKAVGAFEGIKKGIEDGRETGLSAEDTEGYLDAMQQVGNLVVLDSDLKIENVNSIGNSTTALYVFDANAQYSVDLTRAEVKFKNGGDEVVITVPQPQVELYIDETSRATLAEISHFSLTNSAKDGIEAYANSMDELKEKAYEKVSENEALKQIAMEYAVEQIKELASAVSESYRIITVEFREEGQK